MQTEIEKMREAKANYRAMELAALEQAIKLMDGSSGLTIPVQERLRRCEKLIAGLLAARKNELTDVLREYLQAHPQPAKPELNPEAEFRA